MTPLRTAVGQWASVVGAVSQACRENTRLLFNVVCQRASFDAGVRVAF